MNNKLLLVEDHTAFRQALAFMFDREADFLVRAQAGSLAEARKVLTHVDLAIIDLELPDGSGLDLIHDIHSVAPQCAVLVLTAAMDRYAYALAIDAGASGVMHKSSSISDIINAVRRLSHGESLLSSDEIMELLELANLHRTKHRVTRELLDNLTAREREVLQMLTEGLSDKDIAQRMRISNETVRTHMVNLLRKLGAESRLQALVLAVRHGMVNIR